MVLGGDLNDLWGTLGPSFLNPAGFSRAGPLARTFPAWLPVRPLDGLFVRGDVRVRHAGPARGTVARQASDHLPLGAELEARLFSRVEGVPANSRKCPRCRGSLRHTDHDGRQAEVCVACGGIVLWTVKWTEEELVGVAAAFTAVPQPTGRPVADGIAMGLDGAADLAEAAVDLAVDGPDLLDAAGGAVDLAGGAVELAGGAAELALHAVDGVFSFLGALLE